MTTPERLDGKVRMLLFTTRRYFPLAEVARVLHVPFGTLRDQARRGDFPTLKRRGKRMITKAVLRSLYEKQLPHLLGWPTADGIARKHGIRQPLVRKWIRQGWVEGSKDLSGEYHVEPESQTKVKEASIALGTKVRYGDDVYYALTQTARSMTDKHPVSSKRQYREVYAENYDFLYELVRDGKRKSKRIGPQHKVFVHKSSHDLLVDLLRIEGVASFLSITHTQARRWLEEGVIQPLKIVRGVPFFYKPAVLADSRNRKIREFIRKKKIPFEWNDRTDTAARGEVRYAQVGEKTSLYIDGQFMCTMDAREFSNTFSRWVRYGEYEGRFNGTLNLLPQPMVEKLYDSGASIESKPPSPTMPDKE